MIKPDQLRRLLVHTLVSDVGVGSDAQVVSVANDASTVYVMGDLDLHQLVNEINDWIEKYND